jgi:multicomponent K+:H+ antiporter subunit G
MNAAEVASAALPLWLDAVLAALVLLGAAFALVGSWGLAKLSDFLKRLHGPTKATTLGVGCVLLASIGWFGWQGQWGAHELLVTLFLFITAPVSAHLLIQAAMKLDPRLRPPPPPDHVPGPDPDAPADATSWRAAPAGEGKRPDA